MGVIAIEKLSAEAFVKLEERARAHDKSVEEEAADILDAVVGVGKMDRDERLRFIDEIAANTPKGVVQDDSTLFIRSERRARDQALRESSRRSRL
jgi:plasmid stability protein